MLESQYVEELADYLSSGKMEEDFKSADEEQRKEMLGFLEQIMDLGERADKTASFIIYKYSQILPTMAQATGKCTIR